MSETSANINLVSVKIEVEGHILRVTSPMDALQHNLNLLTVLYMHVITGSCCTCIYRYVLVTCISPYVM
jgi:hypothetical protein